MSTLKHVTVGKNTDKMAILVSYDLTLETFRKRAQTHTYQIGQQIRDGDCRIYIYFLFEQFCR